MFEVRTETPLLIIFMDLTRFFVESQRHPDVELADVLDRFYELTATAVSKAGGRTVKFIGDGCLVVFPENAVDRAVEMLLDLKPTVDAFMRECGWDCRFTARVHFGTVVAGPFGAVGEKRFDIIGKAANTAAVLDTTGVSLSVAAFRKLGPEMRKHFKKHTPPVTYIRSEDPRPRGR